jgi:hypothetical protein
MVVEFRKILACCGDRTIVVAFPFFESNEYALTTTPIAVWSCDSPYGIRKAI